MMIMQVHDELVLEVRDDQVEEVASILNEKMTNAAQLKVPLLVETGIGQDWEAAH
jgi:DNA polymerase-1